MDIATELETGVSIFGSNLVRSIHLHANTAVKGMTPLLLPGSMDFLVGLLSAHHYYNQEKKSVFK